MSNGHLVHWAIIIAPRVRRGYPNLAFQCITDFNCRILAVYGPLRTILTFIMFKGVGVMMSCGVITLQKAEWSRIVVRI